MASILEDSARVELEARIDRLTADSTALWGRMTLPEMVAHVAAGFQIALGELETEPVRTPMGWPPFNYILIHWMPWPKGKIDAPKELRVSDPAEFEVEIAKLRDVISRFVAMKDLARWPPHPFFGRLSTNSWGVLAWRHVDHHLRQFGC